MKNGSNNSVRLQEKFEHPDQVSLVESSIATSIPLHSSRNALYKCGETEEAPPVSEREKDMSYRYGSQCEISHTTSIRQNITLLYCM